MTRNISYFGLLLIGLGWLVLEFIILGPLSYFEMHDNGDSSLSAIAATAPHFLEKNLWYPYGGGGTDRYSLGYFGGFETFLFWAFPDWLAASILATAPSLIGGVTTYVFSRRILGLTAPAAVFAGLGVALFSATGKFYQSTGGFFPLVLWGIHRGLDKGTATWKRWLWLCLPPLLYGTTTHIQMLPFALLVGFIWFLLYDFRRSIDDWLKIILALAIPLLPRLQDIVSLAMLSGDSHRTKWVFLSAPVGFAESLSNAFNSAFSFNEVTFFVFVGVWAWIAVARGKTKASSSMKAVSAVLVFVLFFPVVYNILKPYLVYAFPFLERLKLQLGVCLPFFAVLFGAFGAQTLTGCDQREERIVSSSLLSLKQRNGRAFIALLAALFLLSMPLKALHGYDWVVNGNYRQNFSNPLLEDFVRDHPPHLDPYRVASFQMFPSPIQSYGLETADGYMPFYSRRYHDFWQRVVQPLEQKFPERAGSFEAWGSRFNLSANVRESELNLGDYYDLDLLSLANVRYVFSRDRLTDESLQPMNEVGPSWNALGRQEKAWESIKANLWGNRKFDIYENRNVLPRFFVAGRVKTFSTEDAILDAMSEASAQDFQETVFMMDGDLPPGYSDPETDMSSNIQVVNYAPDKITLDVDSQGGPGILVVLNNYSPHWRCLVNGKNVEITPAYHTFWGIPIDEGPSSVEFTYDPPWRL